MKGRNIMVARKRAKSAFPQDGRKLFLCEVGGMELEKKKDYRYWREREKCGNLCGTAGG